MLKRAFDIVAAVMVIAVLSPVLITVAVLVALKLGRPILFTQVRPGYRGRPFTLVKFRTMTDSRGPDGELLSDAVRLTPFGAWLRSTSLDELPELWNILKGEMSFVGPRPLLLEYLPLYTPEQARRHDMRPGLTGWAQINGRNAVSWEDKFKLDVWYVDNRSFVLDLKILGITTLKVLRRDGIQLAGEATTIKFSGTRH